jgi:hypothetical protein
MILQMAAKTLLPYLQKIGILSKMNPYAVEWVLHYIGGSQKQKTLPKELIKVTQAHIIYELMTKAAFSSSTLWGWANWHAYKGDTSWYTHPTMGVVGGFVYKFTSYDNKFIVTCIDRWDFNEYSAPVALPNGVDIKILLKVAKKIGIPITYLEEEDIFGIRESWLSQFNDKHSFETRWEVEIPAGLKCPIDSPLKEKWVKDRRSRCKFFTSPL